MFWNIICMGILGVASPNILEKRGKIFDSFTSIGKQGS